MPIPSRQALTIKGKPNEAHHDHMRGLGTGANSWHKARTGLGPGGIAFDLAFHTIVLSELMTLGSIMPMVMKGMKFVDSPYANIKFIMADNEEDDDNLAASISSLKAEVSECLIRLNPAPQTIPQMTGSLPPLHTLSLKFPHN